MLKKVFGIETEWSIVVRSDDDGEYYPIDFENLSVVLKKIKDFLRIKRVEIEGFNWEIADEETYGREILRRTLENRASLEKGVFSPNGSRIYVDYPHLEYSTPECGSIRDLIAADKAGNIIINQACKDAEKKLGKQIIVLKNNSNHDGISWASHENYLVTPDLFVNLVDESGNLTFSQKQLINFLLTRQIYSGSGKIGSEIKGFSADFQISQRADFIDQIIGFDTVGHKNLINTRDEPHADWRKFRRFHVIVGDANFCEWAEFLRIGMTSIVLKMLEDGFSEFKFDFIKNPCRENLLVSRDIDFQHRIGLEDEKFATAIEIQESFIDAAEKYFSSIQKCNDEEREVLDKAAFVISRLKSSPMELVGYLDWVTKLNLIRERKRKIGSKLDRNEILAIDICYHDIDPNSGLYYYLENKGIIMRLISNDDILRFVSNPPNDTRAYLRGLMASKWPHFVRDWEELCIFRRGRAKSFTFENRCVISLDSPLLEKSEGDKIFSEISSLIKSLEEGG